MFVKRLMVALFVAAFGITGCGDGGASGAGATTADVTSFCKSYCGWANKCTKGTVNCDASCTASANRYTLYLQDVVQKVGTCFAAMDCSKSDDDCFQETLNSVVPNYDKDASYTRCMKARADCLAKDQSVFSDDYCADLMLMTSDGKSAVTPCFDKPCNQIKPCMQSAMNIPH